MVQNVAKDSSDFPVPQQLIMGKIEAITRRMVQDKKGNYLSNSIQFIGLLQGHQKIYDYLVQKVSQTPEPK